MKNVARRVSQLSRAPYYNSSPNAGHGEAGIVLTNESPGGGLIVYSATDTYNPATGSGTYQILLKILDGVLYAGKGVVKLNDGGISITSATAINTNDNMYKFVDTSNNMGGLSSAANATDRGIDVGVIRYAGKNTILTVSADAVSGKSASTFVLVGKGGVYTGQFVLVDDSSDVAYAYLTNVTGLLIGATGAPSGLLHLKSTAPSFIMEDSTGAAKSLKVTVDANTVTIEELGGTDIITIDLATPGVTFASGVNLGFHGATASAQDTGWGSITNVTPDKAYDADATTTDELADVLGTLIAKLVAKGILGA